MKRIYITSIFRDPDKKHKLGKLRILDYDTGLFQELETIKVRGMAFHGDTMVIATSEGETLDKQGIDALIIFDRDTKKFGPSFPISGLGKVHLIESHDDKIYMCATAHDRICVVEKINEVFQTSKQIAIRSGGKNTLHFNSITFSPNGTEYHIYCTLGTVFNFTNNKVIVNELDTPHDIVFYDDDLFITNESKGPISWLCSAKKGKKIKQLITLPKKLEHTIANNIAFWGFMRGAAIARKDNLAITASSPGTLYFIDTNAWVEMDRLEFCNAPHETVYDIMFDKDDWHDHNL